MLKNKNIVVVSWNLHKGRSAFGLRRWEAMHRWIMTTPADIYFLQEAVAKKISLTPHTTEMKELVEDASIDQWHCHVTEIANALKMQLALGQNVIKNSHRHGNAILSPHALDLGGRWDISAHRFEKRGLLVGRLFLNNELIILLCVHLALTRHARLRQMHWIAQWIETHYQAGPLILAGDFNDWRNDAAPIFKEIGLEEAATSLGGLAKTFPAFSPTLALDKIFIRGFTAIEHVKPNKKAAWLSDHLPYIVKLKFK